MDLLNALRSLRTDPRLALLETLPRVDRGLTATLGLLILAETAASTGFVLASGFLVGMLPEAIERGGDGRPADTRLAGVIASVAGTLLVMQLIGPFRLALAQSLGRRLEADLQRTVMQTAFATNGVQLLEHPGSADLVSQMRGVAMGQYTPALAVLGLVEALLIRLGVLTSLVLIAVFTRWWLAAGILLVLLVVRSRARGSVTEGVSALLGTTQTLRRAGYLLDTAMTPSAAKETRVFGLSDWIVTRMRTASLIPLEKVWSQRRRIIARKIPWLGLLVAGAVSLVFLIAARLALSRELSLGDIAIAGPAIVNLTIGMLTFTHTDSWLEHGSTAVPAALEFERRDRAPSDRDGTRSAAGRPQLEIRFEHVGFAYPGSATPVFHDLDFTIPSGESLAIVGENGSGKTTLIKLLCKLYEPTSGRILVDGIDLRHLDTDAWRRRLSVIFQDYIRYEDSARDNVTLGAEDDEALARALERAGAQKLVDALPHRERTILSRHYDGGTDLSGGQWQRIALARALFAVEAGAGVLILDEPTASLDVRAEAAIYDRFLELTQGLTAILISHRFSTVRKADTICVIEHGAVVERGPHEELLAAGGRYAELYTLQASRFAETPDTERRMEIGS